MARRLPLLVDLESELAVEIFGDRKIGNSEMETVDGMNAKFARASGRLDGAANGGHGASSHSLHPRAADTTGCADGVGENAICRIVAGGQDQRARALPPDDVIGRRFERRRRLARRARGRNDGRGGFGFFFFGGGAGAAAGLPPIRIDCRYRSADFRPGLAPRPRPSARRE